MAHTLSSVSIELSFSGWSCYIWLEQSGTVSLELSCDTRVVTPEPSHPGRLARAVPQPNCSTIELFTLNSFFPKLQTLVDSELAMTTLPSSISYPSCSFQSCSFKNLRSYTFVSCSFVYLCHIWQESTKKYLPNVPISSQVGLDYITSK